MLDTGLLKMQYERIKESNGCLLNLLFFKQAESLFKFSWPTQNCRPNYGWLAFRP